MEEDSLIQTRSNFPRLIRHGLRIQLDESSEERRERGRSDGSVGQRRRERKTFNTSLHQSSVNHASR